MPNNVYSAFVTFHRAYVSFVLYSIIVQSNENFSIFEFIALIDLKIKQPACWAASTRPTSSGWLCSTVDGSSKLKKEEEEEKQTNKINKDVQCKEFLWNCHRIECTKKERKKEKWNKRTITIPFVTCSSSPMLFRRPRHFVDRL